MHWSSMYSNCQINTLNPLKSLALYRLTSISSAGTLDSAAIPIDIQNGNITINSLNLSHSLSKQANSLYMVNNYESNISLSTFYNSTSKDSSFLEVSNLFQKKCSYLIKNVNVIIQKGKSFCFCFIQ